MKLVKILTVVALLATVALAGNGVIISAGLNMSNLSASGDYEISDNAMLMGFNVGASYLYGINDQMGVMGGLAYETRGTKYDSDDIDMSMNLSYIQIPVLFSYMPIPAVSLKVGPEIGIKVGAKAKVEDESEDIEDIAGLDIGLTLGASYTVADMVVIGAGYTLGFMNIDASDMADDMDGGIKNSNIKLSVGYLIKM